MTTRSSSIGRALDFAQRRSDLVDVSYPSLDGSDFSCQSGDREAPVGTIEAHRMFQDAVIELGQQLESAVAVFVDKAPGGS